MPSEHKDIKDKHSSLSNIWLDTLLFRKHFEFISEDDFSDVVQSFKGLDATTERKSKGIQEYAVYTEFKGSKFIIDGMILKSDEDVRITGRVRLDLGLMVILWGILGMAIYMPIFYTFIYDMQILQNQRWLTFMPTVIFAAFLVLVLHLRNKFLENFISQLQSNSEKRK